MQDNKLEELDILFKNAKTKIDKMVEDFIINNRGVDIENGVTSEIKKEGFNIFYSTIRKDVLAFNNIQTKNIIINEERHEEMRVDKVYVLLHEYYHIKKHQTAPLLVRSESIQSLLEIEPADYFAYAVLKKTKQNSLIPLNIKNFFNEKINKLKGLSYEGK